MFVRILRYFYRFGFVGVLVRMCCGSKIRPSSIGFFCFLKTGVNRVARNAFPLTLKTGRISRLVSSAREIDVVLTMPMGGGATMYLQKQLAARQEGRLSFVAKPDIEAAGRLRVEVYWGGCRVESFLVRSLAAFRGLQGEKVRLVVNELVTWHHYEICSAMSTEVLERILDPILSLRKYLGAEMVFMVHDYFCACPRWTLISHEEEYCRSEFSCQNCKNCLLESSSQFAYQGGIDIALWRCAFGRFLSEASEVRTFSRDTEQRVLKIYPGLKTQCVPHRPNGVSLRVPHVSKAGIVIGVFGPMTPTKGSRKVEELRQHLKTIGRTDVRLVHVDRYVREEMPDIVEREGINVAFFSSLCPETFSFVTQELMMMELPIVCFDLGAPAERLRQYDRGAVAKDMSAAAVWNAIEDLMK